MIDKNWKYNWYDFSDIVQKVNQRSKWYSIIMDNVDYTIWLSTNIYNNANYHGSYSSSTLWNQWRIFSFSWSISATSKEDRARAWRELCNYVKIESNPNSSWRWFYNLSWETWDWLERTVQAKVYSVPKPVNWIRDTKITFTFELFSETEWFFGTEWKTATGKLWSLWGRSLPMTLPMKSNWYINSINITNNGNHNAPIKILVVWELLNPKIVNITNWYKYRIDWTTNNLVMDNTNIDNDPTKRLIVTDMWHDIKAKRNSWSDIYLSPGDNQIVVLSDNINENATVMVYFRDTYSS